MLAGGARFFTVGMGVYRLKKTYILKAKNTDKRNLKHIKF